MRHFAAGLRIGELSLPDDFDGLLPWGYIDNRPFLRCLHGERSGGLLHCAFLFRDDAEGATPVAAASQKSQRVAAVTVQAVIRKGRFGFGRKPLAKMDSGTADLDAISVKRLQCVNPLP